MGIEEPWACVSKKFWNITDTFEALSKILQKQFRISDDLHGSTVSFGHFDWPKIEDAGTPANGYFNSETMFQN